MKNEYDYAKAYVKPQPYENLFSINDVLKTGTIFKDLYMPYHTKKRIINLENNNE